MHNLVLHKNRCFFGGPRRGGEVEEDGNLCLVGWLLLSVIDLIHMHMYLILMHMYKGKVMPFNSFGSNET